MNIEQLANLIESTPEFKALIGDPKALLVALTEKTVQRTNTELQTFWGYGDRYGVEYGRGLAALMKQLSAKDVGVESFWLAFQTVGRDLANSKIQGEIEQIIASVDVSVRPLLVMLKEMGIWMVSQPMSAIGIDPIEEDITDALTIIMKRDLQRLVTAHYNRAMVAVQNGDAEDWATVQKIFSEDLPE